MDSIGLNQMESHCYTKRVINGERLLILMPLIYSAGFVYSESLYGLGKIISFFSVILFIIGYSIIKYKLPRSISTDCANLLAIYSILSLIFSLTIDYDSLRDIFLNPAFILPYLCVLLSTKKYDYNMPKIMIYGTEIAAILFIIFSLINFRAFLNGYSGREAILLLRDSSISFDSVSKNFAACVGLGLLLAQFLKPRTLIILISAFAINLLMAIFLGRRNIVFTNCLYLLASCYLYAKYSKIPRIIKCGIIIAGLFATIYGALNVTSILRNSDNPLFRTLNERMDLDSRGSVIQYYDTDMNSNPLYWIFGKGIDSRYYCPGIEETSYRRTVEAGWRHIIMKVGIIGFILYLLILLPAVFKKKRNLLTKGCGIYILIGIIELYPAGVPTFYLQYVLLWIAASFCYDNKFNKLSNSEVTLMFK